MLKVLARRWWVVATVMVLTFGITFAVTSQLQKRYSSIAWLRVGDPVDNLFNRDAEDVSPGNEQRAILLTLDSPRLRARLEKLANEGGGSLIETTATGLEASPLIRLDVTATTAALARNAANEGARFVIEERRERRSQALSSAADVAEVEADRLNQELVDFEARLNEPSLTQTERITITDQQTAAATEFRATVLAAARANSGAATQTGGLEFYENASLPRSPSFPQPFGWAVLASLASMFITSAILYARAEHSARFTRGDASEGNVVGARMLGVMDNRPAPAKSALGIRPQEVALRLLQLRSGRGVRSITIAATEGPAPVALAENIAKALTNAGERVVLLRPSTGADNVRDDFLSATDRDHEMEMPEENTSDSSSEHREALYELSGNDLAKCRDALTKLDANGELAVVAVSALDESPTSLAFASLTETTIVVATMRKTRLQATEITVSRLQEVGSDIFGLLIDTDS